MPERVEKPIQAAEKSHEHKGERLEHGAKIENRETAHAALDTMATIDAAEATTGRVSETLAKGQDQDSGGGASSGTAQQDQAAIREELLKNAPPATVMMKQIEKEVKKEIKYLHKRAMNMITKPGEINYFEMNNIIKKMRELKGILKTLLKASIDGVKTIWLRFVHGIM